MDDKEMHTREEWEKLGYEVKHVVDEDSHALCFMPVKLVV